MPYTENVIFIKMAITQIFICAKYFSLSWSIWQNNSLTTHITLSIINSKGVKTALKNLFPLWNNGKKKEKFYQYLLPGYPNSTVFAAKLLSMFGTTYLCEQVFSVISINKINLCSRLTHTNLNHILKLTVTQNVTIDIDAMVKAKRCQVSGAK